MQDTSADGPVFLFDSRASPRDWRLAATVVAFSVLVFIAAAPFARHLLPAVFAFIPIYETTLIINDLITTLLLLSQFVILRARALLILACGYLYTALMAGLHALSFPGLFSINGWLSGGTQTTAWMYLFWHCGFPLTVIGYALSKSRSGARVAGDTRGPVRPRAGRRFRAGRRHGPPLHLAGDGSA